MRSSAWQRTADDVLGRVLILAFQLFRRKRPIPDRPEMIVVLQPTAIGDAVLASGVLHAINSRYPDADIRLLHGPSNRAAFALYAETPELMEISFNRPWEALAKIRALKPDLVVDLTPWSRTTALCAMLSGAVSVGFGSEGQGRKGAFDIVSPHRSDRHEFENISALAALFAPGDGYTVRLKPHFAAPLVHSHWPGTIIMHPCAGGSRAADKAWPNGHWIALAQRLIQMDFVIAFTGVDRDGGTIEEIVAGLGGAQDKALDLSGRLSLSEICGILQRAAALVTVDTSILHIADALGTPTVALHGPTRARRWGPRSPRGVGLDSPHPDAGYISLGFESCHGKAGETMAAISVDRVINALSPLLLAQHPNRELAGDSLASSCS